MNTREEEWDVLKGIGIVLVILAHLNIPVIMREYIYSFHMPLFIYLSGAVYKQRSLKKIYNRLLIPFYLSGIIISFFYYFFYNKAMIKTEIINVMYGGCAPNHRVDIVPAIWFLTALFIIEFIYIVFNQLKLKQMGIWSIGIALLGFLLAKYRDKISMCYNIDIAFVLLPFFLLGIRTKKIIKEIEKMPNIFKYIALAVFTIIGIVLAHINGQINIFRMIYGKSIFLYYFLALVGIAGMLFFCTFIRKHLHYLAKRFEHYGKCSLYILCTHQLLLTIMEKILLKFGITTYKNIYTLVILIGILIIYEIITKLKYFKILRSEMTSLR